MTMLRESLLSHLNFHLCLMFLETKIGMLLEPEWGDWPFTDSTKDRQGRRVVSWVVDTHFSQGREIICKHLSSYS